MIADKLRVLQLGYYPIARVLTGGQRRITNVRRALDRLGLDHRYVGFIPHRDDGGPDDVVLTREESEFLWRKPTDFELRIGTVVASCRHHRARLQKLLVEDWDVLWFEHPFLWPAVQPILCRTRRPRIVYQAHNVEWQIKRDLLANSGTWDEAVVVDVYRAEKDLVWNADLVVAVSPQDRRWFEGAGARQTLLFPNGADIIAPAAPERTEDVRQELGLQRDNRVLIYVSSDHVPNWLGLKELVLDQLVHLGAATDLRIVVVGGIGSQLRQPPWAEHPALRAAGEVDDATKAAIFSLADGVLLPITVGGGTNLKTAEALLTRLPVIGTSTAFRGFERFQALPRVTIANTPAEFAQAVSDFTRLPQNGVPAAAGPDWHRVLQHCEWTHLVEAFARSLEPLTTAWRTQAA